MQYTENYQLGLWELSDQVVHDKFNENTEKIDAALGELAAGVTAAATAAAAGTRIAVGTYTGTGKSGSKNPQKLTVDFQPKFLLVWGYQQYQMPCVRGQTAVINVGGDDTNTISQTNTTWGSNYVSWYNNNYGDDAVYGFSQMNTKDTVYSYVIIG